MRILRTSNRTLLTTIFVGIFGITSASAGPGGVTGKVTLQGQPSKAKTINMSSEPGCAKLYSTPPTTEEIGRAHV